MRFESGKIKVYNPTVFSWLILILSILTTYSNLQDSNMGIFVSSDTFGVSNLYYDIFFDEGNIKSWYLAASPSLFPDISIYFLLLFLFKAHALVTSFMYGVLQVITLVGLLCYIYKRIVPEEYKKYSFFIPIFISLFFIESFYFSHDGLFSFLLIAHCYHIGPFINSLLILAIFLNSWSHFFKYLFITLLSVIGAFSDKLFLVMLVAPFIVTLLISLKKGQIQHNIIVIICLIIGSVSGLWIVNYLTENKLFIFINPHSIYDVKNAVPSFNLFTEQLFNYIKIIGFRSFQIVFTFISIVACVVFYFKYKTSTHPTLRFSILFYVIFSLCTFSAPIVNGNYTGYDTIRYNVYPFFLAAVIFALCFGVIITKKMKVTRIHVFLKSFLAVVFVLVVVKFDAKGLVNYLHYYPEEVAEIDIVAKKYHLKKGISDYWTARKTTVLSKQGIKILPVHSTACLNELGHNIDWYSEGEFDFIISNSLIPEVVHDFFTIKDTIVTKNYTILLVDPYIYPKGTYAPKTIIK